MTISFSPVLLLLLLLCLFFGTVHCKIDGVIGAVAMTFVSIISTIVLTSFISNTLSAGGCGGGGGSDDVDDAWW